MTLEFVPETAALEVSTADLYNMEFCKQTEEMQREQPNRILAHPLGC